MLLPAWLSHDVPLWDPVSDWPFASAGEKRREVGRWGEGGRGRAVHQACRFAALRAFQMAVIYEPLRMVGLMNATRHVFGMEGLCSAITLSLRRGSRTLHHKH